LLFFERHHLISKALCPLDPAYFIKQPLLYGVLAASSRDHY
jgi:hypothetical protein